MIINGLSKLTLLDFPGRVAATVFLAGCNLRCPYCHNAPLVLRPGETEQIGEGEFFAFLKKRRGLIDGICITGGEPTLRPDLPEFIEKIRNTGYAVKLDTNGTNPGMLALLTGSGMLDYVAMDIKNSLEKYSETVGIPGFETETIKRSAAILMSGAVDYEFRTTVVKSFHEKEDFNSIGRWLAGAKRYLLQNFVDSGDLIVKGTEGHSPEKMAEFLEIIKKYIPGAELRGI